MRLWQLLVVIACTLVLALATGWQPFWVLTYAVSLALVFSLVWLAIGLRGLVFARSEPGGRAEVGDRIEESLTLENHSIFPKLWVEVYDGSTLPGHHAGYVSSVGPRQRISWRARTTCRRRGKYTLGPVTITTGDPFGLVERREVVASERSLLVLPKLLPLRTLALHPGVMSGHGRGAMRSLYATTNAVTVREYVPGDALTRIHWPSTARQGDLMVKEFDLDPTTDVMLLADLSRDAQAGEGDESTEEYIVTLTASMAAYLLRQQGLAVGLAVSGASTGTLPFDRGERQLERMLETLAVARPERMTALLDTLASEESRLGRNTVLVLVTSSTDLDWPGGLAYFLRRGVRPLVLLLDRHSFDDNAQDSTRVYDALVAVGIRVIRIARGDNLAQILEQGPN